MLLLLSLRQEIASSYYLSTENEYCSMKFGIYDKALVLKMMKLEFLVAESEVSYQISTELYARYDRFFQFNLRQSGQCVFDSLESDSGPLCDVTNCSNILYFILPKAYIFCDTISERVQFYLAAVTKYY